MGSNEFYIGLISGTSADGIDAALVSFGDDEKANLLAHHLHPFPTETRRRLISLFTPADHQIDLFGQLDRELGELFGEAAVTLIKKAGINSSQVTAIGSHGQTVRHRPDGSAPFSLQIGDPNVISEYAGIDVVADFRRRDMACGGQGAPLAPLFHQAFLSHSERTQVVLNLGGIANTTLLPSTQSNLKPLAMDTGPASGLMDAWCQLHLGTPFDADGNWAREGEIRNDLLEAWLADPYFQLPPPKSTGKEYFHLEWAKQRSEGLMATYQPVDVQATLLELSTCSIAAAIDTHMEQTEEILVCGGGIHNQYFMERLKAKLDRPTESTLPLAGIDPDWVEAMCFAWLARCHLTGTKLNTAPFTGASRPVLLGGLYQV